MDLYLFEDYKLAIKALVKAKAKQRPGLTLKRLAEKLRVQHTYFSRVLNDEKAHLSEDQLYIVTEELGLLSDETDFLYLLRSLSLTQSPSRKNFLQNKLALCRRQQKLNVPMQEFEGTRVHEELSYLFDPLCVIVHVALFIAEYAAHPRRLCSLLGISAERLELSLKSLDQMQFIERTENGNILRVLQKKIHYGTDHPLMRAHQHMMHVFAQAHLLKIAEGDKQNFITTFSADPDTVAKVQQRFRQFLQETEALVSASRSQFTYQMQFDLFRWF